MAIIENKEITGSGFKKTIDEDSMEMILDMTQVSQYQKPHHSAVRETVSNGVDSVIERNLAKNIITGKEKLENHYDTSRSEGKYKGSSFDKDYYDTKFFDNTEKVMIEYFEKSDERDLIRITDYGVGLGGKRLEKSFNPGYSSKRLSKDTLGSFGIGAKSPLATGAEFYTMISNHNGRKYRFKIYVNKVDCLVPKFSKGKMNPIHEFENGYNAFYEETTDKNGVTIEWEVKKHNRDIVSDAIRSQLMYFDNVVYRHHNEWSRSAETVNIKSDILYADEEILVPKNTNKYTNEPHILLGKEGKYVNYGSIDWEELELPKYQGGVGFKMSPSDVSISPSRENLVWNEKTKTAILNKFDAVKDLVNEELKDKLKETDFVKWNVTAETISSNLNRNHYNSYYGYSRDQEQTDLVSVLSKLMSEGDGIALKYSKDYSYKSLSSAIKIKEDSVRTAIRHVYVRDVADYSLNRLAISSWSSMDNKDVYITEDDKADRIKDIHINKLINEDLLKSKGFILIHKDKIEEGDIADLLFNSEAIKDYDSIEVSDEDRAIYQNKISQAEMTPAERRKLDKKVVAKQYLKGYSNTIYTSKVEYRIGDMATDFTSTDIIYGHRDDDPYLRFAAKLFSKGSTKKVLLISQGNLKHYKPYGQHVVDYLLEVDETNKTIDIASEITDAIKANYISKTNVSFALNYLNSLSSILKYETEVYNKLLTIQKNNQNSNVLRDHYLSEISKGIEDEGVCNVPFKEHDSYYDPSTINVFEPLQKLLDKGYTINPINVQEYGIADKLKKRLAPYESFINDIRNLNSHSNQVDTWLNASGYTKLTQNHGWI